MKKIVVFASGEGTNAENLIRYFKNSPFGRVSLVVSSNPVAPVLDRAEKHNIPSVVLDRASFYESSDFSRYLKDQSIELIVLAGFLWMIPQSLIEHFPDKVINLHPALLPKFGGKGMYGNRVHEAVLNAGEKESGISIHFVNEHYDEGELILQKKCEINEWDTAATLAEKIHKLEHEFYPKTIEQLLK